MAKVVKLKKKESAAPQLNCADLFSGAGGFSLAAQNSGFNVKLAIENDKHACATYRHNLCTSDDEPKLFERDITELDPYEIYAETFHGMRCDLLLGGPPCQGFSAHRIKDAGVKDPRNSLIHTYFEFVKAFQPSLFLMENVPGMLWPRHESYLKKFYKAGQEAGYYLYDPVVLDTRDYGLPQRRKRVFVLGVRAGVNTDDFEWPLKSTHGNEKARLQSAGLLPWVNCVDVFRGSPKGDENNIHMNHSEELIEIFKSTPANGGSRKDSCRVLQCHKDHDGHKDVYGRIDPKQPGPTMTTACINPSKGRFVHPTQHHGITLRQAARLQTFPDSFVFKGGLIASGQQIGNAVPPMMGECLIAHLKKLVLRINGETDQLSRKQKTA